MIDVIREAGWPVFLILFCGLISLGLGIRQAMAPTAAAGKLLKALIGATVLLGVLGTAIGVQMSAGHIGEVPNDQKWIFLIGLKESLHNLTVALVLAIPSLIAAGVGAYRLKSARP